MATQNKTKAPGLLLRNAGIFNPVLVQAVGLCPVIAMATTLKGAALLAVVATAAITLCELIASMFLKVIPRWVRTGLYIIFGGAIVTPFMILIERLNPELFGSLGIYLPVMAVNSLLVLRCERFAVKFSPIAALKDGFTASLGYAAVLLLVGSAREILGSGSIAGFRFWDGRVLSGLLLPFGGFLMIGFSAAALRTIISVYWPKFLDRKQPKPGAKKVRNKKPVAPLVPDLPDFSPEDDPFSLDAFANSLRDSGYEPEFILTEEKKAAHPIGKYGEIIIEDPEYIQAAPARKLSANGIVAAEGYFTPEINNEPETEETLPQADSPQEFAFEPAAEIAEDSPAVFSAVAAESPIAADSAPQGEIEQPDSDTEAAESTDGNTKETTDDTESNNKKDEYSDDEYEADDEYDEDDDEYEDDEDDEYDDDDDEYEDENISGNITDSSVAPRAGSAQPTVYSASAKPEVQAVKQTPAFDIVADDELEMLLNRPVDDIFAKHEEGNK